ncbi:hypothetical protein NE237_010559 [Protea cynaroides]|uniref:Uncharacterized protein n=1 Tax=Protea cynaroides TaxID=273540 RepID=A0A9Q0L0L9_9MAGN|nr:hypothetical protein NE237_010559 [Protea cynaroides]
MIKIADAIAPYEERVIIISSVDKDSKVSEAENALHLIASIILTDEDVNAVASVGNIEKLRNESGTSIMILGQNQFPLCAFAHDSDRMVQISAAQGSKAEQKAKKKQVEDEISRFPAKLKGKQSQELASLGYSNRNGKKGNLDTLVKAIAGVSVVTKGDISKPSRSLKRRENRAHQEAARKQRIQDEQSSIVSDRMIENEKLERA